MLRSAKVLSMVFFSLFILSGCPQGPKTSFSTPKECMDQLVWASKKGNLEAISHCYAPPMDRYMKELSRLQKASAQLHDAVAEKMGKDTARELKLKSSTEMARQLNTVASSTKITVEKIEKKGDQATAHLKTKVREKTVKQVILLEKTEKSWKIVPSIGKKKLKKKQLAKIRSLLDVFASMATTIESLTKDLKADEIKSKKDLKARLAQIRTDMQKKVRKALVGG